MNDCNHFKDKLLAYIDAELPPGGGDQLERHLATCGPCSREVEMFRETALGLSAEAETPVDYPQGLWEGIERRLADADRRSMLGSVASLAVTPIPRSWLIAAAVAFAVGLGAWSAFGPDATGSRVVASTVDFGVLLDALSFAPGEAFDKFLSQYDAKKIQPEDAWAHAPDLSFAIPDSLPGGYRLKNVFALRFGGYPGVAVEYYSDTGQFFGSIFHSRFTREGYGLYPHSHCVIGEHRGDVVEVGPWRLVHFTDPTTCHCILSQLDPVKDLPEIVNIIAPYPADHAVDANSAQ